MDYCREEIIKKYNFLKVKDVVIGGKERQHSVLNGLRAVTNCEIVLIHDGARPFINESIIQNAVIYANLYGATACGVMPKDTIKMKDSSGFSMKHPIEKCFFVFKHLKLLSMNLY